MKTSSNEANEISFFNNNRLTIPDAKTRSIIAKNSSNEDNEISQFFDNNRLTIPDAGTWITPFLLHGIEVLSTSFSFHSFARKTEEQEAVEVDWLDLKGSYLWKFKRPDFGPGAIETAEDEWWRRMERAETMDYTVRESTPGASNPELMETTCAKIQSEKLASPTFPE
ncbi:hypothetical protein CEXT_440961 [Caerostris extrusa]|uniref:Uncharacterized protein n=1 Tax=Caerostris extrusa TaxID=172846 RepID=A0AAV4Y3U8_CAEEX|nr:hypothetical protein CEXT_440961 [Caerostris extrusa]